MEVETRALKTDYEEFFSYVEKSIQDVNKLLETMSTLSGMWKGSASLAFANRIRTDGAEFQKIFESLREMANDLNECGVLYEKNERSAKELIESIKV